MERLLALGATRVEWEYPEGADSREGLNTRTA